MVAALALALPAPSSAQRDDRDDRDAQIDEDRDDDIDEDLDVDFDEHREAERDPEYGPSPEEVPTEGPHELDEVGNVSFVPGTGLRVTSADERFRLEVRARGQIAYDVRGPDDWRHQIQIRRARLQLSGYTFSPNVRFKLEIALSPADVGISDSQVDGVPTRSPLLDFYVDFRHLRDLQVRVGQYKVPSNRQRVISSGNLQLVDRSILNAEMTLDRDVGFDLRSADFLGLGKLRYYAGVYMGRGRGARGYDDFGLMYLGRVEVLPFGLFDDYVEGDFDRTGPRLSLGAGYVHVDRARRNRGILGDVPVDGGTTDTHHLFVDAHFKARGFSLLAEWSWRSGARIAGDLVDDLGAPIPTELPRNGTGANLQAGYLFGAVPVELAARYAFVRGLGETSLPDANELTVGASYYPGRHPYKVQLDYSRLWADALDQGDHRIRLQIQVSL
tara:strand:+ start:1603 stop:2934 length:1332 start_codon:yes stop_codon:yes gene_type:complete